MCFIFRWLRHPQPHLFPQQERADLMPPRCFDILSFEGWVKNSQLTEGPAPLASSPPCSEPTWWCRNECPAGMSERIFLVSPSCQLTVLQHKASPRYRSLPLSGLLAAGAHFAVKQGIIRPNPNYGARPKVFCATAHDVLKLLSGHSWCHCRLLCWQVLLRWCLRRQISSPGWFSCLLLVVF